MQQDLFLRKKLGKGWGDLTKNWQLMWTIGISIGGYGWPVINKYLLRNRLPTIGRKSNKQETPGLKELTGNFILRKSHGFSSKIINFGDLLQKRNIVQSQRKISDTYLMNNVMDKSFVFEYFIRHWLPIIKL